MSWDTWSVMWPGSVSVWVFQHQTPWRPDQGWSGPDLCPSSICPQICPLGPWPSCVCLCILSCRRDSLPLCLSGENQHREAFAEERACKSLAAHLQRIRPRFPALIHQLLSMPILSDLIHTLFPRCCELHKDQLFGGICYSDHVWSESCRCYPGWEHQIFARIHFRLLVIHGGEEAWLHLFFTWLLSLPPPPWILMVFVLWWALMISMNTGSLMASLFCPNMDLAEHGQLS